MTINIIPTKDEVGFLEMPNGFWPAFCVETPVNQVLKCHYKEGTDKGIIVYFHDGYVGGEISENESLEMLRLLKDFVKTDEYLNHEYFASRTNQMAQIMQFLADCGGFIMQH